MVVLCGSKEITGACFYQGLSYFLASCDDTNLRGIVAPIIHLLGDTSILQLKKYTVGEPFRLGVCSLSQLIDMFRLREASDIRDKVYALLGITLPSSSDTSIVPDYNMDWASVFRRLVTLILGPKVEANWITANEKEYCELNAKTCALGYISKVDDSKSDRQIVSFIPTYDYNHPDYSQSRTISNESVVS